MQSCRCKTFQPINSFSPYECYVKVTITRVHYICMWEIFHIICLINEYSFNKFEYLNNCGKTEKGEKFNAYFYFHRFVSIVPVHHSQQKPVQQRSLVLTDAREFLCHRYFEFLQVLVRASPAKQASELKISGYRMESTVRQVNSVLLAHQYKIKDGLNEECFLLSFV